MLNAKEAVEAALKNNIDNYQFPKTGIVMGSVFSSNQHTKYGEVCAAVTAYRQVISSDSIAKTTIATSNKSGNSGDTNSGYELILEPGNYILVFYADGYLPVTYPNVVVDENKVTYLDDVFLIEGSLDELKTGMVTGQVTDANNGAGVAGVTIEVYPGINNITGVTPDGWSGNNTTTVTDRNGHYMVMIDEGAYTLKLSKEGYVTSFINVVSFINNNKPQNAVISPAIDPRQYRIVLTWGEGYLDLDAHLSGPLGNGNRFHTYYRQPDAYWGSTLLANLDLHRDSFGLETITIYVPTAGVYRYAVHDYSNCSSDHSWSFGMSSAKVEVFKGNQKLKTYHVPETSGTVWHVFEIIDGVITDINEMTYGTDPELIFYTYPGAI